MQNKEANIASGVSARKLRTAKALSASQIINRLMVR